MKQGAASTLGVLVLAVCAPAWGLGVENYSEPDAATVKAHFDKGKGLGHWEMLAFMAVDGQPVSGLRGQDMARTTLHLRPGEHSIAIMYDSPKGIFRSWTAEILVRANLKAGGNYQLAASREGDRLKVWIEDIGTHSIVSKLLSASGPISHKDNGPAAQPGDSVAETGEPAVKPGAPASGPK